MSIQQSQNNHSVTNNVNGTQINIEIVSDDSRSNYNNKTTTTTIGSFNSTQLQLDIGYEATKLLENAMNSPGFQAVGTTLAPAIENIQNAINSPQFQAVAAAIGPALQNFFKF